MPKFWLQYGFIIYLCVALASCGMPQANSEKVNQVANNKTAAQILGDSNYQAICYGGYRQLNRDSQPSIEQVKEDLKILHAMGIKVIRTYNTKYDEVRTILQALTLLQQENPSMEMYMMLGAWINCEQAWTNTPNHEKEDEPANAAEIARAVELTNQYPHIIKIISVGNEAMVKWATNYHVSPGVILKWVNYLQRLKKEKSLPQDVWITSSDNFASWGGGDTSYHVADLVKLYHAVDYVSIHTYPMHDTHYNPEFWKLNKAEKQWNEQTQLDTLMLRSLAYAQNQYWSVTQYMKSIGVNKPIHIGETGWASSSDGFYGNEGSKACDEYKSAKYYQLIKDWTKKENITCFYFEAFDEQWKDANNPEGSENHFGLFTIDGKAKYSLWNKVDVGAFNALTRNGKPIVKTYNGKVNELLKTVQLPEHN
jgi:exo-beta-1,3-glucanase (GH17 family)